MEQPHTVDAEAAVEFFADVLDHARAQEQEAQQAAERTSVIVDRTRPNLRSVLDSLDERGASHGYSEDEIRQMKRDAVIAHLSSRRTTHR